MDTPSFVRRVAATLGVFIAAAGTARADRIERVRAAPAYLQSVIANASERSPLLRNLIQRIDESNLIVHVTCEQFRDVTLRGRTVLVWGNHDVRYVRVQVDCILPIVDLVAILGHELQHVAEIAAADTVVDARSFVALYKSIGFPSCGSWLSEQYETEEAKRAGERVRFEYARKAAAH